MALPKRRPMDAFPVESDGNQFFVLRDVEGLLDDQVVVDPFSFLVWNLVGQQPDLAGLQADVRRYAGDVTVPEETLKGIVDRLDEHLLLDSPRAAAKREQIASDFRAASIRPAKFAGKGGYAAKPAKLREELDAFFTHSKGAGAPDRAEPRKAPKAILAPHIDFHRGGPCYTHAYRELAESEPADTYVILGVAHQSPPSPFVLSTKGYATPYGTAEADLELCEAIRRRAPGILEHEIVHRTEHSAEFQAVFLKHVHPEAPFRIVPILCSSWEALVGDRDPSKVGEVEDVLGVLRDVIRASDRRVTLVAGVDFAHIGPRFGDSIKLDDESIGWMTREDAKSLQAAIGGDARQFWGSVMADGNRRHVCGLSATYSLLRLLDGAPGRLKAYDYAPDPAGGLVSFASAVYPA